MNDFITLYPSYITFKTQNAAAWALETRIPDKGEIIIVQEDGSEVSDVKIGDGQHRVSQLTPIGVGLDPEQVKAIIIEWLEEHGGEIGDSLWETGTGLNSVQTKNTDSLADGDYSVAEGQETRTGDLNASESTIEIDDQVNSTFGPSHAEGFATLAKPMSSHAEGYKAQAIGFASHAEGNSTQAKGINSHAEGVSSWTMPPDGDAIPLWRDGYAAHAEGHMTTAGGRASHVEGDNTVANNPSEHAEGRYNVSHYVDGSTYGNGGNTLHSVGFGSGQPDVETGFPDRKNAFEIMQNGDVYMVGVGGYNGTTIDNVINTQDTINSKMSLVVNGDTLTFTNVILAVEEVEF